MNMFNRFFKKPQLVVDVEATARAHAAFQSAVACEKMGKSAVEPKPASALEKLWGEIIGLAEGNFLPISTELVESGANGTGYFDGLSRKDFWKTHQMNTDAVYMGKDSHGRTVVLIGRGKSKGFQVLFNRYSDDNRTLISQTSTAAGAVKVEVGVPLLTELYARMAPSKPSEQEEQAAA